MGRTENNRRNPTGAMKWLSILYPRRCPICGEIVTPRGNLICKPCLAGLKYIHEPSCVRCGRQLTNPEDEFCSECEGRSFRYQRGFAVWQYDTAMRESLGAFKYHSRKEYADFYIAEAIRLYGRRILEQGPEVLVPVPIHSKKRRMRGFNQAECLAKKLGRGLGIPVDTNLLMRSRNTVPLKELGARERARELKNAFSVSNPGNVVYRNVMLVDDIYTTGSTMEACAGELRRAGVEKVTFLCIAIGAARGKRNRV